MSHALSRVALLERNCRPLEGKAALDGAALTQQIAVLPDWQLRDGAIERSFAFDDYYSTIAFVNAMAWVIHRQDHHPDLVVGYNRCVVRFNTHSVNGISENDFICAAKCDALFAAAPPQKT